MAEKRASDSEEGDEKKKANHYDTLAFFFKQPYSQVVHKGPFRVKDKEGHRQLVEKAKEQKVYLWYATVVKTDNNRYQAVQPHIIDFDSVPEHAYGYEPPPTVHTPVEPQYPADLKCPKCGVTCSSTSGYTLHMKAHERNEQERAEKYPADLKCTICGHKCNSTSGYTLHMKAHQQDEAEAAEEPSGDALRCPHCKKKCSSTSGLTLHIKHQHPDQVDE